MQVLNFHSEVHRAFAVDVFVSVPFDFESGAMSVKADTHWETATWEGSRRAQLRAALAVTVRERLEALEALAELAQRLAEMPRKHGTGKLRGL